MTEKLILSIAPLGATGTSEATRNMFLHAMPWKVLHETQTEEEQLEASAAERDVAVEKKVNAADRNVTKVI